LIYSLNVTYYNDPIYCQLQILSFALIYVFSIFYKILEHIIIIYVWYAFVACLYPCILCIHISYVSMYACMYMRIFVCMFVCMHVYNVCCCCSYNLVICNKVESVSILPNWNKRIVYCIDVCIHVCINVCMYAYMYVYYIIRTCVCIRTLL